MQRVVVVTGVGVVRILAALPGRWVLNLADAFAVLFSALSGRSRRVAHENLRTVYGADFPEAECRRIFLGSWRTLLRARLRLAHLQPLTPAKYRRWVHVDPDLEHRPFARRFVEGGGILVSGHVGNWELLLGMRVLYQHMPRTVFLAEAVPHKLINEVLVRLRSHADLEGAFRRGGARVVARVLAEGGIAALLVDRNVRRQQGGLWVPFLGLEARTTPLAAWAALRYEKPVHMIFCMPTANGRYRLEYGEDLTLGLDAVPPERREYELMRRINAVLEGYIHADPTLWQWRLKRFKSRPHPEQGRYPGYSEYDPD